MTERAGKCTRRGVEGTARRWSDAAWAEPQLSAHARTGRRREDETSAELGFPSEVRGAVASVSEVSEREGTGGDG